MSLYINVELPRRDFTMNIDLVVDNKLTGIYGHSGSGKTSLIHLISGLERPRTGVIKFNNKTMVDTSDGVFIEPRFRRVGVVFQDSRLFKHMSVRKNLLFGVRYSSRKEHLISFEEVVDMLDLNSILESSPLSISGGEKQRVALGRALLSSPELLLLDEPFSAVDISMRKVLIPFIERIHHKLDIPIVVISHDLPDLLQLTNSLILMKKGQVVTSGDFLDLLENPDAFDLIHGTGVINVLAMKVGSSVGGDITKLISDDTCDAVELHVGYLDIEKGSFVKASIAPCDILLSKDKITNTSANNILKGMVENILDRPAHTICIIDIGAGKKLAVEVTRGSIQRLGIECGVQIYCLFKANSVKVSYINL